MDDISNPSFPMPYTSTTPRIFARFMESILPIPNTASDTFFVIWLSPLYASPFIMF